MCELHSVDICTPLNVNETCCSRHNHLLVNKFVYMKWPVLNNTTRFHHVINKYIPMSFFLSPVTIDSQWLGDLLEYNTTNAGPITSIYDYLMVEWNEIATRYRTALLMIELIGSCHCWRIRRPLRFPQQPINTIKKMHTSHHLVVCMWVDILGFSFSYPFSGSLKSSLHPKNIQSETRARTTHNINLWLALVYRPGPTRCFFNAAIPSFRCHFDKNIYICECICTHTGLIIASAFGRFVRKFTIHDTR